MMRHRRLEFSPAAINDLIEIYNFIAAENPTAARQLIDSIEAEIRNMAQSGSSGVPRSWIRPGLRALPFKNRCVYFRIDDAAIYVLRIVHGHQNISPEDFTESDR